MINSKYFKVYCPPTSPRFQTTMVIDSSYTLPPPGGFKWHYKTKLEENALEQHL